jgi:hypothetical protein
MGEEEKGELGDYVTTLLPGLVVSQRFKAALDTAAVDNIQYIPAEIIDEVDGLIHKGYFVANVLGMIECMDRSRSKVTMRRAPPGSIRDINELHIDEDRARSSKIFRLSECTTLVLINESVRVFVEAAKLRGVALVPAEGYST